MQQGELNVVLLMIDVDNFKQYNDTYGHLAGNKVLVELAQILSNSVDSDDIVARYGGEEFVIVLHDTSAERARPSLKKLGPESQRPWPMSLSPSGYHRFTLTIPIGSPP